ncbi:trophoblast glycoprotein [Sarcophilus harrisii]|uniref:Trophoblast glycoprotein n=1 Tax=Sarcophilus harrisii TaxID=9305 RepID=A0A7N4NI15_SARHA|nr:trophoblast glycoprotein [Sarcophilus harrisii]XP_031820451.1 trophoblast glycoprotein [Sarcophilus harrisii]
MPGGCARGPAAAAAAGDRRLRLARLLLVLLGWVSSSTGTSSSSPSSSSTSSSSPSSSVSAQPPPPPPPPPPGHCPAPCECSEAARTVKCVNKNLTEVPEDLPRYVRTLFFTGNQLAILPSGAFASRPPLAELATLNLSGSCLQEVSAGAFEHLPSLRQLDLSHNPLADLSPVAFSGGGGGSNASSLGRSPLSELFLNDILPPRDSQLRNRSFVGMVAAALQSGGALGNLLRLELSGNNFIYLPRDMFSGLPKLKHLDLHNNSLVGLGNLALGNLTHLETLHLGNNAFKALYNASLVQLQSLPNLRVNLDNNPWLCDCNLVDMVAWLKETNVVEGKASLSCFFPEKMRNRPLVKLNSSDLDCDPLPLDPLQTSYVFLGIVLALIGAIFLLVLYLNRKGIKKWLYNIRDACRDHMEGYHYRYEINADPRLTNLSSNSDV